MKFAQRLGIVFLFAITMGINPAMAQAPRNCAVPLPLPNYPVQWNYYVPAIPGQQGQKETKEQAPSVYRVPGDRFLVIDSISLKGTVPANTYVAIELRTLIPTLPQAIRPNWVRHFIFSQGGGS
jgi:hypothetical protein